MRRDYAVDAASVVRREPRTLGSREPAVEPSEPREHSAGDRVLWVALAACGSLLLSAVTNHISQNVATIPLLWIAPLVAYLLSFVVAFGGERWRPQWLMLAFAVIGLGTAGYLVYKGILHTPILRAAAMFCGALFLLCLFLHSELYRRRPPRARADDVLLLHRGRRRAGRDYRRRDRAVGADGKLRARRGVVFRGRIGVHRHVVLGMARAESRGPRRSD